MKKGNIIFSTSLDHGDFIRAEVSCETKIQAKMRNAAYTLRKIIMEAKRTPLSENLNIEDIAKGEIMIPDPLLQFFTHLICGSDKRGGVKESKKCRVEAICLPNLPTEGIPGVDLEVTPWNESQNFKIILSVAFQKTTNREKIQQRDADVLTKPNQLILHPIVQNLK